VDLEAVAADFFAAMAADEPDVEVVVAGVPEGGRRRVDGPLVAPGAQGLQHDAEFAAGFGELVLVARRVLAVAAALDDARGFEGTQAGREAVAGRAGVARDHVEALVPESDLAHGEQRPLLSDQVQGRRHGAGPPRDLAAGQFLAHAVQDTSVAESN
jgi:hypothetical protein